MLIRMCVSTQGHTLQSCRTSPSLPPSSFLSTKITFYPFCLPPSCPLPSLLVPIIPTFLYALDHGKENLSTSSSPLGTTPQALNQPAPSILSLYDNTTFDLPAASSSNSTELPSVPALNWSGNSSQELGQVQLEGCQQDSHFLEEENIRVGLLFASKALVQLLVNPFVGPLTNRHLPMFTFQSALQAARV